MFKFRMITVAHSSEGIPPSLCNVRLVLWTILFFEFLINGLNVQAFKTRCFYLYCLEKVWLLSSLDIQSRTNDKYHFMISNLSIIIENYKKMCVFLLKNITYTQWETSIHFSSEYNILTLITLCEKGVFGSPNHHFNVGVRDKIFWHTKNIRLLSHKNISQNKTTVFSILKY